MENINELYSKSYKEVVTILKCLPKTHFLKIPKEKIEFYNAKMDKNYEYKLDKNKSFAEQEMLPITEAILAILYRDYIADEEERQNIINKDKFDWKILEDKKREKYNPDNLFKKQKDVSDKTQELQIIIPNQKWHIKILNFIKRLFKIK